MVDELLERMVAAGYVGIRAPHSRVFEALDPDGSRISELAARVQMTHQAMSELATGLEAQGYVERRPDSRRPCQANLPDAERACLLQRALTDIADIEAAWLDRLRQHGVEGDLKTALAAALDSENARRHRSGIVIC